ncbi:SpoIIE family protein phosphatase [Actinomadura rudentiformis]|uniref:SpoIIE family protein phosphatase n=1 Tax=Actinomadura rudentiformis TaxID=359158 RepID=A0A6H9YTR8_9ACTN|nr:SpoIIE family protein phosphatase [Actinomadura rudentiformis]KAB2346884.1 SpoIIE family protein phosphatase [Actinomadura rudentiformis]
MGSIGMKMPDLRELRAAMRGRAVVAEARVVLADRLGCHEAEALQHLIWLARDLGMELEDAATLLVAHSPAGADVPDLPPDAELMRRSVEAARQAYRTVEQAAGGGAAGGGPAGGGPAAGGPDGGESGGGEPGAMDEPSTSHAEADAASDARLLASTPEDPVAQAVLDAALGSACLLVPIRAVDGHVVDFLHAAFGAVAEDVFGRSPEDLIGRRLLRTDPGSRLNGLFPAYVEVLETGRPFARGPFDYTTVHHGTSRTVQLSIRCVRVPTGVCLTWRFHDEEERLRRRLDRSERLAKIGFAEWNLATDEHDWSPQMLANYGRAEDEGPIVLDELPKIVEPADLPLFEQAVHVLFNRREPVQVEFRIRTPDGANRHLWLYAEPTLDRSGLLTNISALTQDVTSRRSIEGVLAETRRDLLRLQGETARERQVALTLRRAVLPPDRVLAGAPGVSAAVRSIPAENTARIGGDWYVTRVLPGGRSMFAVGDASGHGLAATADMARMRNGLLGLAYTGEDAGRLLSWLNDLVHDVGPATTGTAVIGHFDPETRELCWAGAGHPPPILVRDGRTSLLEAGGEPDPLLGAFPGMEYRTSTVRLHSGDLVVLYTDGLVERRGTDLDDQIDMLAGIAASHDGELHQMLDDILKGMGHDRFADDTTLFALRVR